MAEPFSRWQLAVCSGSAVFLAAVLALHPGARFQGRSVAQLLRGLTSRPEPVLLLATDDLPDGSALDLIGRLREQLGSVPLRVVLFLEDQLDRERLLAYLRAGVQTVQRLETFDGPRLTAAMERAVQDGPGLEANLDPHYVSLLVKELQPQGPVALMELLGERERSMLQLVAQGYNASEIADYYDIRSDSVRRCLSQAYQRIGVRDRAQAVGWCLSHGIVTRQELDRLYRPSLEPPES